MLKNGNAAPGESGVELDGVSELRSSVITKSRTPAQARYIAAIDVLVVLRQTFPAVIGRLDNYAVKRPLKVGVRADVIALLPEVDQRVIAWALRIYTMCAGYQRALVEGSPRIDLAGNAVGSVTAAEAACARARLLQQSKPQPPQPKSPASTAAAAAAPPKRLGLDDLRAAARMRR